MRQRMIAGHPAPTHRESHPAPGRRIFPPTRLHEFADGIGGEEFGHVERVVRLPLRNRLVARVKRRLPLAPAAGDHFPMPAPPTPPIHDMHPPARPCMIAPDPTRSEGGCALVGMFDKDKEIGTPITDLFPLDESLAGGIESRQFILWKAAVDSETVETDLGAARKTRLVVSDFARPNDKQEVSTLASAIADKAEEAEPDDFPCVVKLMQVRSKKYGGSALVLQYVKPYAREADGTDPFAGMESESPSATPKTASRK